MHPFKKMIYMLSQVVEGVVTPPVVYNSYAYRFSAQGGGTSADSCAEADFPVILYSDVSTLAVNSELFFNPDLSNVFTGGGLWYKERSTGKSYRVDGIGKIVEVLICNVNYQPPSNPPSYEINISYPSSISNCAGAGRTTYPTTVFVSRLPIMIGDAISENAELHGLFDGTGEWYSTSPTYSIKINVNGAVTDISECTIWAPE